MDQCRHKRALDSKLSKNPFCSLAEAVYEILLKDIVEFKFEPGAKLVESQLALDFGVSRSPVREAINLLADHGFVSKGKNAAALISSISADELDDLVSYRMNLESLAASYAAQRMTEQEDDQLGQHLQALCRAYGQKDHGQIYDCEHAFHEYIIQCSHNRYIIDGYKSLTPHLRRSRLYSTARKGIYEYFIEEHQLIVNSLKLRDGPIAASIIRRHLSMLSAADHFKKYDPAPLAEALESCSRLPSRRARAFEA